jgi:dolichyl-phosphate-mannose-protein mannosyltransferase
MLLRSENAALADIERPEHHRRLEWLVPIAICAFMLGQLLLTSRHLSQTADEATHLYSGYRYLKCGDLTVSPEHPPLAKVIAAAPLVSMNFAVDCAPFKGDSLAQAFAGLNWFYTQDWPTALLRARAAISIFAVGLCALVWLIARRMFGFKTAVVASLLLVLEPNILAYGPLVLTDIPVTCMLVLAVLGFYLWTKHRRFPFLLLTAMATGLTLLAKHSGVVIVPILLVMSLADAAIQPGVLKTKWQLALRNLLTVALVCALAVAIVWMGYGMRFAEHSGAADSQNPRPNASDARGRVLAQLEAHHLLPQAYVRGLADAVSISSQSSAAFVGGQLYSRAPWFSTPLNFAMRSTLAMLAMMIVAVFGAAFAFRQRRREFLFVLVPVAVYLAVCLHASTNVSIRYLLPMYPFLLLAIAAGCVEWANRARWLNYALPCLLVLHAASSLHAWPNYLSYANELWGGPAQAYKYQPWLDVGQAYPQAKEYLEKYPTKDCWFIAAWQWDPQFYDVPCQTISLYLPHQIPPHVHGTVIISSTLLTDVRLADAAMVAGFKNSMPKDHIAGSALLVYQGDFDTSLDSAAGESNLASAAFSGGQLAAALEHAKKAVTLAPASPLVHANLCRFLATTQLDAALNECYVAKNLLLSDPLREETTRSTYLESIENSITALKRQP